MRIDLPPIWLGEQKLSKIVEHRLWLARVSRKLWSRSKPCPELLLAFPGSYVKRGILRITAKRIDDWLIATRSYGSNLQRETG